MGRPRCELSFQLWLVSDLWCHVLNNFCSLSFSLNPTTKAVDSSSSCLQRGLAWPGRGNSLPSCSNMSASLRSLQASSVSQPLQHKALTISTWDLAVQSKSNLPWTNRLQNKCWNAYTDFQIQGLSTVCMRTVVNWWMDERSEWVEGEGHTNSSTGAPQH